MEKETNKKKGTTRKKVVKKVSEKAKRIKEKTQILKKKREELKAAKETSGNKKVKDNTIIIIAVVTIGVIIGLLCFNSFKNERTALDKNSPTYQGKKIIEKNGKTIIEEENGSKTIETRGTTSEYIEATKEIREKYEIKDVKVSTTATSTVVKGKIKNVRSRYRKVYVNVKFYQGDEIVGSSSTYIENLGRGKIEEFEIKTVGQFNKNKYKVNVEYVG